MIWAQLVLTKHSVAGCYNWPLGWMPLLSENQSSLWSSRSIKVIWLLTCSRDRPERAPFILTCTPNVCIFDFSYPISHDAIFVPNENLCPNNSEIMDPIVFVWLGGKLLFFDVFDFSTDKNGLDI